MDGRAGRGVFDGVFDEVAQQHLDVSGRRFDGRFLEPRFKAKPARFERQLLLFEGALDPEGEVERFARRLVLAHFERVELQQVLHKNG